MRLNAQKMSAKEKHFLRENNYTRIQLIIYHANKEVMRYSVLRLFDLVPETLNPTPL